VKSADIIRGIKTAPTVSVVYGDEPQLIEEFRSAVKNVTQAANVERADWETLSDSPIMEERGSSLFGNGSCLYDIVGHGAPSVKAATAVLKLARRMKPPDILIIAAHHLERKHYKAAWLRDVSALGCSVCAKRLNASETAMWCRHWAEGYELNIEEETLQWLASHTEGNLAAAKQCLLKMQLAGDKPDAAQMADALSDGARHNVFNLIDAALAGHGRRALSILSFLLETQEPPPLILWATANALQSILTVKKGGTPAWGLPAQDIRDIARRTSENEVTWLLRCAATADRTIKGVGDGEIKIQLMNLIVGLAALRRGIKIGVPNVLL
jgi:DNA polymerase-3 subunit delta